tara:strand:+ start:386 stop:514 length:129 start_codon:yes stop_codon:yes gene_type:complete
MTLFEKNTDFTPSSRPYPVVIDMKHLREGERERGVERWREGG